MPIIRSLFFTLVLCSMARAAWGGTFVGNGGSSADIALQVTLTQLTETLEMLDESEQESLCHCEERFLEASPSCQALISLNQKQQNFCAQLLKELLPQLSQLASPSREIEFRWTHQSMEILSDSRPIGADAVANRELKQITLYQKRFEEQSVTDRLFLITHELFHFTKWRDKDLVDSGSIGPFESSDGGRQLINAMSNSLVVEALSSNVTLQHMTPLLRSHYNKRFWFQFGIQSQTHFTKQDTYLLSGPGSGLALEFRMQFHEPWCFFLKSSSLSFNSTDYGLETTEFYRIYGGGVGYRFNFFSDPMSYWGQSFLLVKVGLNHFTSNYQVADQVTTLTDEATGNFGEISLSYFFPLHRGFWIYLETLHSNTQYSYPKLNLEQQKTNSTFVLGGGYAF